jgi:hypothetical protein
MSRHSPRTASQVAFARAQFMAENRRVRVRVLGKVSELVNDARHVTVTIASVGPRAARWVLVASVAYRRGLWGTTRWSE